MRKLTVLALGALLMLGCPKEKSSQSDTSSAAVATETVGSSKPLKTSTSEPPFVDPFAGTVNTSTGFPNLDPHPFPSKGVGYEIMVDTFYDWSPEQEKLAAQKLGREFEPFRSENRKSVVASRVAEGWEHYKTYPVPGVPSPNPNPFINATHHMVMYKRSQK